MARCRGKMVGIHFILRLRMFFGFYYNFCENIWLKYAIKALLTGISVQYVYLASMNRVKITGDVNEISRIIEYIIYVICSLQTEEQYLINYYSIDTTIDDKSYSKNTRKNIVKYLIFYIVLIIIFTMLFTVLFLYFIPDGNPSNEKGFPFFYMNLISWTNDIGRIPIMMVFILLYFRVKIFCTKLRNEISNNATNVLDWKEYVKIYIKILDSLEKTDWPIKFMMLVHLIVGFINVIAWQFFLIRQYKRSEFQFDVGPVYIVIKLLYKYAVLFYPSVIMEMITDQLDGLKIHIADRMITCSNERRRTNMRELLKYFREHPLKYCICRAFQVCSRMPLGYLSLAATYLVCLLQFTHVFK